MIQTNRRLKLCTALLAANLIFIWGNSLLPGEVSGAISDWVKAVIALVFRGDGEDTGSGFLIRKLAHFTEFACLGALLAWYFGMRRRPWALGFCLGAAAAAIDETIQIFVPNRGPRLQDVAIDCCGVLTGMILLHLGYTYFHKKRTHQFKEDK